MYPSARSELVYLKTANDRQLAYRLLPGKMPTVVFLCGFKSDMEGTKALFFEEFCRQRGQQYLRFDYSGHGRSSGLFEEGTIGQWAEDTAAVLDSVVEGPLVLVGSSMGGWIMLLAGRELPQRIAAMIGIAAAPDFTEDLIWPSLLPSQQEELMQRGRLELPSEYDDGPYVITRALIEDGRRQCLLKDTIPLQCPVHLIQGMQDPDVPWATAPKLAQALQSENVQVTLLKQSAHRLSEPHELTFIANAIGDMLDHLESL